MRFETRLIPLRPTLDFRARRQKKVLALVLAMAMSLSLAVSAGAAFNDQDKIVNDEAVDMCVALNIINGRTNGDFDPAGNVTRAEAAKMICIALNGGKEPVLSASATSAFADINGHWAAKYIEYCVSLGIVAGKSATQFDPNGNVTGTELAKMLLIALGYNAQHEKFVGANWDTNVNVVASQNNLYEELESIDPSLALSRDNAAQMIWNALQADMVKYEYTLVSNNGELTSQIVVKNDPYAGTLVEEKYDAEVEYGYMSHISYDDVKGEFTYDFLTSASFGGAAIDAADAVPATMKSAADYSDLFAQKVAVVYDITDNTVYGMYAADSSVVATGYIKDISDISGKDFEIAGVEYTMSNNVSAARVWNYNVTANAGFIPAYVGTHANGAYEFALIDNTDDGKGDAIVAYPFGVEKVTFVNATKFTTDVTFTTAEDLEDVTYYEGMAKDDYVVVTAAANTVDGVPVLEKAEVVTGKIDGFKTDAGIDSVRVDGVWYEESAGSVITQNNGATVEMVVVNGYVYVCTTTSNSVAATDIVYLEAAAIETVATGLDAGSKLMGKIVDAEGNIAKAQISKIDGDKVVFTTAGTDEIEATAAVVRAMSDKLYSFEKDGDKYELTLIDGSNKAGYKTYSDTATAYDKDDATLAGYDIADDAVIYVKAADEDDTKVITGAELKTWSDKTFSTGKVLTLEQSSKFQNVAVAAVTYATLPISDNTEYGYVVSAPFTTKVDGTTYYNFTIFVDGENKDVISEDSVSKGDKIAFAVVKDNEIDVTAGFTVTDAAVLAATESRVQLKDALTTDTYKITDKTVIIYIDSENVVGSEGGAIAVASDADASNYKANVSYKLTSDPTDKEIAVIYVATNGQMGTATIAH